MLPPPCCLLLILLQLQNPRLAWARPSNEARTLTRARPPPEEPSALRQLKHGGRYLPQQPPRRSQGSSRRRRDPHKAKGLPRTAATPGAIPHSVLPTVADHCAPLIRGKTTTPQISRTCTPLLLVSIKGGGGLLPKSYLIRPLALHSHTRSPEHDIGTCLNHLLL